uniref:ER membrane protein complex subunit 1 n=1 Tax=Pinguiococcus pyrenoidosus TaxID=172671 RepID=A0A7R9YCV5_9STRA
MVGWARSALLAFACLCEVRAIYEDQAGVLDWHQKNLGRVRSAVVKAGRSFVASDKQLVGALRNSDGRLLWRYQMPNGEEVEQLTLAPQGGLLVLSKGGRSLRMLSSHGSLLWDVSLVAADAAPSASGAESHGPQLQLLGPLAFVLADNAVTAVDLRSGASVFEFFPETDEALAASAGLAPDSLVLRCLKAPEQDSAEEPLRVRVVATGRHKQKADRMKIVVFALTLEGSQGTPDVVVDLPSEFAKELASSAGTDAQAAGRGSVVALGNHVVILAPAAGKALSILNSDKPTVQSLGDCGLRPGEVIQDVRTVGSMRALVITSSQRSVTLALTNGMLAPVTKEAPPDESVAGVYSPVQSETVAIFRGAHQNNEMSLALEMSAIDAQASMTQGVFQEQLGAILSDPVHVEADAPLQAFWPFVFEQDGKLGLKLLLQFADGALVMLHQGETAWRREEALASVLDAKFVVMTPTSIALEHADVDPLSFKSRMEAQMQSLHQLARLFDVQGALRNFLAQGADSKGGVSEEASHNFGFAKIVVLLAAPGPSVQKLFGVDIRDGAMLWSKVLKGDGWKLLDSRSELHKTLAPEILLLRPEANQTTLLRVDATSGADVQEDVLAMRVDKVLNMGISDPDSYRRVLALITGIDAHPQCVLYPDSAKARALLGHSIYFHHVDSEAGTLRSFVLELPSNDSIPSATETGIISWPPESERVAAVAYGDASAIKSATHELGDGSLLIKYLNPNLAVVATVDQNAIAGGLADGGSTTSGDASAGTSIAEPKPSLFINAVDVVSAKVLYRVGHVYAAEPFHVTLHENWIIYSYWNYRVRRTEVGAISLFEGHVARNGLNPFNKPERSSIFSAFGDEPPVAMQRSFSFPHGITALGITKTAAGITPRACIIGMESGQVFMLDRRLLDPRRPMDAPKKSQKEEGLVQYTPHLPLHSTRFVNYNTSIVGLDKIFTAPARLESTTLVLAAGVDLFGTRTTPAKSFDLLSADFNKPLLLVVLACFVGGTVILRALYRTRRLRQQWK